MVVGDWWYSSSLFLWGGGRVLGWLETTITKAKPEGVMVVSCFLSASFEQACQQARRADISVQYHSCCSNSLHNQSSKQSLNEHFH